MNVELKDISNALALYGIKGDIINHSFFNNYFDEEESEAKFILKADLSDGKSLVVRFIRQEGYPRTRTEEQSRFSEHLRKRGVLTPNKYRGNDAFCIPYRLNELELDITVEDYIGETCNFYTDEKIMYKIGQLVGGMHRIAEEDNLHLSGDSLYNLMSYDEFTDYASFVWYGNNELIDKDLFNGIRSLYEQRYDRIGLAWNNLPQYATQGDYCTGNLTYNGNELGIFDYNNAGDGTLVYDMIIHGIYNAMDNYRYPSFSDGLSEDDKLHFFKSYYDGYVSQRPFSENEKAIFNDLYAAAKGMQQLRINVFEDSLKKLIERKEQEKIDALLQKIYHDLRYDYLHSK